MVAHELVPELALAAPGEFGRLLPDAAVGEVEVLPGNDGFEIRCRPSLGGVPAILDEIEARVLKGLS